MSLLEIFCDVDDFMLIFDQWLKEHALTKAPSPRGRKATLLMSEVMTILIWFHQSHYRDFKTFYLNHVCQHLRSEFPKLVSYSRFVDLIPGTLLPMCVYMYLRQGRQTGIAFVDSTPIAVCHNKRIRRHKTFAGLARRGKSTMGYFYGFKLHLVVNDQGEILAFCLTPGNTDDRNDFCTPLLIAFPDLVSQTGRVDLVTGIHIDGNHILISNAQDTACFSDGIVAPPGDENDTPVNPVGPVGSRKPLGFHT